MKKILLILFLTWAAGTAVHAQCTSKNTAFSSGETLIYDLYFNWKFIWLKAGSATMNITSTIYQGKPSYRTRLTTRGTKQVERYFVLRDTLTSSVTHDLQPLYVRKAAEEGSRYNIDDVWFHYADNQSHVRQRHRNSKGKVTESRESSETCIFDMLSMLLRARSFDPSHFQKGHKLRFLMADGKDCDWQTLIYRGKENFKIENSSLTYRCLVFSFVEYDKGKEKEVITFYVTDDANHLPVRLDMYLNFGTAKAYLAAARNIRNPQTSIVRK